MAKKNISLSKEFECDFSLVQTVYGIALVLGLEKVAESAFDTYLNDNLIAAVSLECLLLKGFMMVILVFLGIRLFAASGNIRRFVLSLPEIKKSKTTTTIHMPILLLHAFLFFMLCRMQQSMINMNSFWNIIPSFIYLYCGLLLVNALWLACLIRKRRDKKPEIIWVLTNIITSVAVLIIIWTPVRSIVNISELTLWIAALVILLLNSIIDLTTTSQYYLGKKIYIE